jgi:hypothetical protein
MVNERIRLKEQVTARLTSGPVSAHGVEERMSIRGHVLLILKEEDGTIVQREEIENLVTTAGKEFYMEAINESIGGGSAPTPATTKMALGLSGSAATPAVGNDLDDVGVADAEGIRTVEATYPKINDGDSDNTGAGAHTLTWKCIWPAGQYTQSTIGDVAVTETAAAFPTSGEAIVNHGTFTNINKTATQTLTVYVNHSFS